ncbi:RluA family pseudouridine synthase [Verrucomicrobiaceae bacterium N1E253]|uniref:Pseudouridine synthase n=1 Tax=Oceaniferula marina TaxID=2748318 RepID=A0A851GGN1_9BACT|nr:RluA family pseudouridine synthase [Oceaniferula marina]NWK54297.1 RluA family pseudouridine synthase [Oceaniferula marina]
MKIQVDCREPQRIDQFLASKLPELSRSRIQSLLKSGDILLNGSKSKAKQSVSDGDLIVVEVPEPEPAEAQAQEIPLDVLYEDDDIIVINKAHGMVVHPAAGNADGTLVNALLHHCHGQLAGIGGVERPGIVHRLDKDTSGCIVCAKNDKAHQSLVGQFAERNTEKQYLTVVQSPPTQPEGHIFTHIGRHPVNRMKMAVCNPGSGKTAITDYKVLYQAPDNTCLVLCDLHTGRTHQIRVHMGHLGTPILGDPIYAKPARQVCQPGRLMLHAWKLSLDHPRTSERLAFLAPVPEAYRPWTQACELGLE